MESLNLESFSPKEYILIKGARVHNLRNIDVVIPKNKLTVITGLSGSGKSSLAFETLYAEGQRRYVESLSAYARQFLGKLDKPEVDWIQGIAPAIAIQQKVNTRNPRSTVGISTEIYDYLKLFFARVGTTYSPISGVEVRKNNPEDVWNAIAAFPEGNKLAIAAPLILKAERSLQKQLEILTQQGYSRLIVNNEILRIEDIDPKKLSVNKDSIDILIDRISASAEDSLRARVADGIETAFYEGQGTCYLYDYSSNPPKKIEFNNRFEADGMQFEVPTINLFSFNNPYGACKTCEGFGWVLGIDEDLVVPDKSLSVYEGAIACWKGDKLSEWKDGFIKSAAEFDFPIHRSYAELSDEQKDLLWNGNKKVKGINEFFNFVESQSFKIQYRVLYSRFRGRTVCPDCRGTRLRKDASYVKVAGKSISDIVLMQVEDALEFIKSIELTPTQAEIAKRLLVEIQNRLQYLCDVGLGYLTLNRRSNSLSGGESQRIHLATSLGSALVGSMYILDEPSIGLHSKDTERLIEVVKKLRDLGNTVIIVEHDEDVMKAADHIIDIGPLAGRLGGEVVFSGTRDELLKSDESYTGKYLSGKLKIDVPETRRKWKDAIIVKGARENNLKNVDVKIPLGCLVAVTGVSGSGKTTLIKQVFYPALMKHLGGYSDKSGSFENLSGSLKAVQAVELVDQNPIGKSSRSNPVTYLKAFDDIRNLYASLPMAKHGGLKPASFSFNVAGGRCDACEGEGFITVEMQFMADVILPCENCKGKRFKEEVLEVQYREKSISDILDMTIDEAIDFFEQDEKHGKKIAEKIRPLQNVGLGYIKLGQSSSTLSGGEAQRVKLAYFLSKGNTSGNTLFIFDEPTTGLHFHDIHNLMKAFHSLIEQGHSIIVIEHNLDVVKCADWIIDMGPEGGNAGGTVVFEGTPEEMIASKSKSYTAKFLAEKL